MLRGFLVGLGAWGLFGFQKLFDVGEVVGGSFADALEFPNAVDFVGGAVGESCPDWVVVGGALEGDRSGDRLEIHVVGLIVW